MSMLTLKQGASMPLADCSIGNQMLVTWSPCCQRTVSASVPAAFCLRGLNAPMLQCWPSGAVGAGADYSVDFGPLLCDGDRIVQAQIDCGGGGVLAWTSIFGSLVTGWITWTALGQQQVNVTVLTAEGATLGCVVNIMVGGTALISSPPSAYAPNAFFMGCAYMPDADGNPLILG